jgi:hypothetical protein
VTVDTEWCLPLVLLVRAFNKGGSSSQVHDDGDSSIMTVSNRSDVLFWELLPLEFRRHPELKAICDHCYGTVFAICIACQSIQQGGSSSQVHDDDKKGLKMQPMKI